MTKFRTFSALPAFATALVLAAAATPAAAEGVTDPNVIYLSTAGGGVWNTHDELPKFAGPNTGPIPAPPKPPKLTLRDGTSNTLLVGEPVSAPRRGPSARLKAMKAK